MYMIFLLLQRLEEPADHIHGLSPALFHHAGLVKVQETTRYMTIFGTLSLYSTRKPMKGH